MDPTDQSPEEMYSVWALPPEPVRRRLLGLMASLRAAHGGAVFEPHATMMATSDHCRAHFDYQTSSLLYGDHLTEEEKAAARKKAGEMDKGIFGLQFEISELALYKTDPKDKSLESWELVELCHLQKK
ncbi:hypothetical protein CFC21_096680 [Triticum aestivum]|uniref:Cyclic phosphodiesterase n=2 Tax=Triticum aestivum TaxID=4565 RepID=A0A3B6RFB6_WHEAT|nr:hypothetical protein CFC21_096680 [Triticum aestivum]